jgi:hypothetical protein
MTATYTITHKNVLGNRRYNVGKVVTASGDEGLCTVYIDTGLRIVNHFDIHAQTSGVTAVVVYPTSFPDLAQQSGYITVLTTSISGATFNWAAVGKS